jgi:hypothetical protein
MFLGEIYSNRTVWGDQASVKEWILVILMKLGSSTGNDAQGELMLSIEMHLHGYHMWLATRTNQVRSTG